MSDTRASRSAVLPFEGIWKNLEMMHDVFQETDAGLAFPSLDKMVYFGHRADNPQNYLFVVLDPVKRITLPHKVYDLHIDESRLQAHLLVIDRIGEQACGAVSDGEELWHETQRELGLLTPDEANIKEFREVTVDFAIQCAKSQLG